VTRGDARGAITSYPDELYNLLADAQEQLLARDDAIRSLRSEEFAQLEQAIRWLEDLIAARDAEIKWLRSVVEEGERELTWLRGVVEEQERESSLLQERDQALRELEATRLWRLGQGYWRLRDRVLRRNGHR
jgi:hypothetical protein